MEEEGEGGNSRRRSMVMKEGKENEDKADKKGKIKQQLIKLNWKRNALKKMHVYFTQK